MRGGGDQSAAEAWAGEAGALYGHGAALSQSPLHIGPAPSLLFALVIEKVRYGSRAERGAEGPLRFCDRSIGDRV